MFLPSRFLCRRAIRQTRCITKVNQAKPSQARVLRKHTAIRTHCTGLLLYTGSQPTVLVLQTGSTQLIQCNGYAVLHHQCCARLIQIRAIKQCQTVDQPVNAVSLLCLRDLMTNTRLKQQTTDPCEKASAWEPTMFRQRIMPEAFPYSQALQILGQSLKILTGVKLHALPNSLPPRTAGQSGRALQTSCKALKGRSP